MITIAGLSCTHDEHSVIVTRLITRPSVNAATKEFFDKMAAGLLKCIDFSLRAVDEDSQTPLHVEVRCVKALLMSLRTWNCHFFLDDLKCYI